MIIFLLSWILTPIILIFISLGLNGFFRKHDEFSQNIIVKVINGFTILVIFGTFLTSIRLLASYAAVFIFTIAVIGFMLQFKKFKEYYIEIQVLVIATFSYFLSGLPVIANGKVSWPGWVTLDDTATFLALTNQLFSEGKFVPRQLISTYDRTIEVFDTGYFGDYPTGSFIPIGLVGKISTLDYAWIYFPVICFCISLVSLMSYLIFKNYANNKIILFFSSTATALASTFYSYALWGGIKEIVFVPILFYMYFILHYFVTNFSEKKYNKTFFIYYIISLIGLYSIIGSSSIGFFIIPLLVTSFYILIKIYKFNLFKISGPIVLFIFVTYLFFQSNLFNFLNKNLVPQVGDDEGNLRGPLNFLQVIGIWISGDFRNDMYWKPYSYAFVIVSIILILFSLYSYWKMNYSFVFISLISNFTLAIFSHFFAGVWLTGKIFAIISPFSILVTLLGAIQLFKINRLKSIGFTALFCVILGVFMSDYLQFRNVRTAPSEKVQELGIIGKKFKGQGPTLINDYSIFGGKYFLRELQAEIVSGLRVNPIPMRDGSKVPEEFFADIDLFNNDTITNYPVLVTKHHAIGSRPLLNYDLVFEGHYYDVWKINDKKNINFQSLALGNNFSPGEYPNCEELKQNTAKATGNIYAAERKPIKLIDLTEGVQIGDWQTSDYYSRALFPNSNGVLKLNFDIAESGNYEWFIAGSYGGKLEIYVDNKLIYGGRSFFEYNNKLSNYLTTINMKAGNHNVELIYSKPFYIPGAGAKNPIGPIYISNDLASKSKIVSTSKDQIDIFCNKFLDWVAWTN